MNSRFGVSVLVTISSLPSSLAGVWPDFIDLKLSPKAKEYCHIIQFPRGWKAEHFDDPPAYPRIDYFSSDYEFRVEGLLGTWFLVGALTPNTAELVVNSTNHYRTSLSDPTAPVLPASRQDWNAAAVVPIFRRSIVNYLGVHPPDHAVFGGFQYNKSGSYPWTEEDSTSRLSPDSAWLVLQSATQAKTRMVYRYDVFFDVFNTATGGKLFTIQGTYSGFSDPQGCLRWTGWVTERYFIIPLGKHRERCVVCEFVHRRGPGGKQ